MQISNRSPYLEVQFCIFTRERKASSGVFENKQICFIILLLAIPTLSVSRKQLGPWNINYNSDWCFYLSNHKFIHFYGSLVN